MLQQITERTDAAILDDALLALDGHMLEEILVTSVAGTVTLDGKVDSWSQRRRIAIRVDQIDGVRGVVNKLVVRVPAVAATSVRMAIEDALARRAVREARRVDFQIRDRRITVTGTVGSSDEHDAVVGAVTGTFGVRSVEDQLHVAPSPRSQR